MAYLISFENSESEDWMIANRHVERFMNLLFEQTCNEELKQFMIETAYVNGVVFGSKGENEMNSEYYKLLQDMLPKMIERIESDDSAELAFHLRDLLTIVKSMN
ncbi:MAG: hypothetical protein ACSHYA_12250 [Opitutaceae bacterium]